MVAKLPVPSSTVKHIVQCLNDMPLPRFVGVYGISNGVLAISTGHTITTLGYDSSELQHCLEDVLATATGHIIVVDLLSGIGWIDLYSSAATFMLMENPQPQEASPPGRPLRLPPNVESAPPI